MTTHDVQTNNTNIHAEEPLVEVIVNGDSSPPNRIIDGVEQTYPLTTVEEKLARKNELKARDGYVNHKSQKSPKEDWKDPRENRNREPVRRNVTVETTNANALVAQDGFSSTTLTGNFMPPKPGLILADVDKYVVSESVTSVPTIAINKAKTKTKSKQRKPSFAKIKFVKPNEQMKSPKESVKQEKYNRQAKHPRKKVKVLEGNPQLKLQEKQVTNIGCSRHMTRNMSYLFEYEEIDGGYVTFGGDPKGDKITTDTKCVLLSLDFKLLDESQPLLRVPRENNMYSVDLKNVAPSGVRGLPSKNFDTITHVLLVRKESNIKVLVRPRLSKDSPGDGFKPLRDEEKNDVKDPKNEDNEDNAIDENIVYGCANDPKMPNIEEIVYSDDDEDVGADADITNLDTNILMDVKSAFLYGKIEEEVYVCQPLGLEDLKFPDIVYKIEKALYGLHQALRLGLQVTQKPDGIFISQDKYVDEILKKFGFSTVKTASTPMETLKPLMKDKNVEDVDFYLYRSMIGSLISKDSPGDGFKPLRDEEKNDVKDPKNEDNEDNAIDENIVYGCANDPKMPNIEEIVYSDDDEDVGADADITNLDTNILDSPFDLEAYTDSDYAGASLDRKSTTGEAGYVAAANCCGQATATAKNINGEAQIHAKVDGKKRKQKPRKTKRKDTELPQTSVPPKVVTDEAVYEEMYNSVERAATTTGLDAKQDRGSGPRRQKTMDDAAAQTRVLDLEITKTTQAKKIANLKKRAKRLEKKKKSRSHGLKRLYKVGLSARVESSAEEESLGEEKSSKQGKIEDIDVDDNITLVNDQEMFDVDRDLQGEEWVLRWTVLIDSSLVSWTVLIEIIALKTILVIILLSRLMKSRWTYLIRNILTVLNEISDCCSLKLLDVIMKYRKIISSSTTEGELLLDTYIRYLQVINDLKKCGHPKDNCELNFKFLNNLQPEWKQYATMMRHNKNLMDINIDTLYNIPKQNQGDVNDAMGSKKKTVVVTSDLLALIAEKTNSANKKQELVKSDDKKAKKADEKKRDMSKTKMLLAKKDKDDKDKQVLLAKDQAWMESSNDSDQEINANMVFMAQIEKVLSDSEASSSSVDEKISE
nr:hypothetical protein [Tanacetum cinerariifolium]